MKKTFNTLLLFLGLITITSCGDSVMIVNDRGNVISKIKNYSNGYCYYSGYSGFDATGWYMNTGYFVFCDTCGKFNVGDTVNLTPKK